MPKTQKLKSNLKSADRRRRRRDLTAHGRDVCSPHSQERSVRTAEVDVARILIEAAISVAERSTQLKDVAVVGALRAIKNDSMSNSVFTQAVYVEMVARLDRAGVEATHRRRAAGELLAISLENLDADSPGQLISYLALIAS